MVPKIMPRKEGWIQALNYVFLISMIKVWYQKIVLRLFCSRKDLQLILHSGSKLNILPNYVYFLYQSAQYGTGNSGTHGTKNSTTRILFGENAEIVST